MKFEVKPRFLRSSHVLRHLPLATSPALFLQWWRLWRTVPVLSWVIAANCFRRGYFRASANYYRKGLKKYANHRVAPYARSDYAYCLYRMNDHLRARNVLYEVVADQTPIKDAFLLLGKIETGFGNHAAAAKVLRAGSNAFPTDIQLACAYGHALLSIGAAGRFATELREKLSRLRREVALTDSSYFTIEGVRARFELLFGDRKLGEQLLARVVASDMAPVEAMILQTELFLESGRILPARLQLRRAMESSSRDPKLYALMARSYILSGEEEEIGWAVQLATIACQRSYWQNPECVRALMEAYERTGDEAAGLLVRKQLIQISIHRELKLDEIRKLRVKIEKLGELTRDAET